MDSRFAPDAGLESRLILEALGGVSAEEAGEVETVPLDGDAFSGEG